MTIRRMFAPRVTAHAHCDVPCGIYDPEQARIEAESCLRIIEKYDASEDPLSGTAASTIKEERAELVKHHLDVLWHDYFKPEHLEKSPTCTTPSGRRPSRPARSSSRATPPRRRSCSR